MARLVSPGRTVVLVAEDESLVRMFTADFLVEAGYTVIEASSAVAALRQLEVTPNVRVLLTDVEMPGEMDGLELAREVQSRWPEVVIIVTSGRARPGREELAVGAEFFQKPLCEEAVVQRISERLSKRRTRKSDHTRPDALP
jgi:CheY-like chemotaxis protein